MKTMKQSLFLLALFFGLLGTNYAIAAPNIYDEDDIPVGEMLNKAGLQRMLTQRMGKSYLAVLLGSNKEQHQAQIKKDIALFESQLEYLEENAPTTKIQKQIATIRSKWTGYKSLVSVPSTKETAEKILTNNTDILKSCGQLIVVIEDFAIKYKSNDDLRKAYNALALLVDKSGRQRMLSQRIMLYYLGNKLGLTDPLIQESFDEAVNEYGLALNELTSALENTPEIDYRLVKLMGDWKRLETLCKNMDKLSAEEVDEVLMIGDLLLDEMHQVTGLYENLLDVEITSLLLGNAINKAGSQRMLTQRIAKTYLASVMGIETKLHKKELQNSINLFEEQLEELKTFNFVPEINTSIEVVEELWDEYVVIAAGDLNKEGVEQLLTRNTELLRACNNIVLVLRLYAKSEISASATLDENLAKLIDKSGRQRMLSQRMMFYCLAAVWGAENKDVDKYLNKTVEEYKTSLNELIEMPQNTPEIKARLGDVLKDWSLIEEACSQFSSEAPTEKRAEMLRISNLLLDRMNEVTGLYEDLISKIMMGEAINKAGRQRMLTQRMAKNYIAILLKFDPKFHANQLGKDIRVFEDQLNELRVFASSDKLRTSVARVNQLWGKYKEVLKHTPTKDELDILLEMNGELLKASHQVVEDLVLESGAKREGTAHLIDVSGRQRMLSQRTLMFYLAFVESGRTDDKLKKSMTKALGEFKAGLETLASSNVNTNEIKEKIDLVEYQWEKLNKFMHRLDQVDVYQVLMIANTLLVQSEEITTLYEQLMNEDS